MDAGFLFDQTLFGGKNLLEFWKTNKCYEEIFNEENWEQEKCFFSDEYIYKYDLY